MYFELFYFYICKYEVVYAVLFLVKLFQFLAYVQNNSIEVPVKIFLLEELLDSFYLSFTFQILQDFLTLR